MTPRASVPRFPSNEEYGAAAGGPVEQREPWPAVSDRIASSVYYWIATARPDGRPHSIPIGAVWHDERLLFNTSPRTVTARNLAGNPSVSVHLEGGHEAVILEGTARKLRGDEVPAEVLDEYARKYSDGAHRPEPADPELPFYAVRPRKVLFWADTDIRNTAVRWRFTA
jgi:nitroimidazol reductase NimA-like FMN-containing flavoprotein (pyridoxamine 5'-phosphate oxidase superfamily)